MPSMRPIVEHQAETTLRFIELLLNRSNDEGFVEFNYQDIDLGFNFLIGTIDYWDRDGLISDLQIEEVPFEELPQTKTNGWISVRMKIVDSNYFENEREVIKNAYPKHKTAILSQQTIQLISDAIEQFVSKNDLSDFVKAARPNSLPISRGETVSERISSLLSYLCLSAKADDFESLQKIFYHTSHPINHAGDAVAAKNFERQIDAWVSADGYRFLNFQLLNTEYLEEQGIEIPDLQQEVTAKGLGFSIVEINDDSFLLAFDGTRARIPFSYKEQWVHVCYMMLKRITNGRAFISHTEIQDYLSQIATSHVLTQPFQKKTGINARSASKRFKDTMNKNFRKAFPEYFSTYRPFKQKDGGLWLTIPEID